MESNSQSIINSTQTPLNSLTKGQERLMLKVFQAFKNKSKINLDEIIDIYKNFVMRSPYLYDGDFLNYNGEKVLKDEWRIETNARSWCMNAIGSLVRKGFLTVVPNIDLSRAIE